MMICFLKSSAKSGAAFMTVKSPSPSSSLAVGL